MKINVRSSENRRQGLAMKHIIAPGRVTVSYERFGEGPPLILVHGSFSDHLSNWQEAKPLLEERFTVYAMARRGRGDTSPTHRHTVADEMADVVAVLEAVGEPAFLLGHSYGAVCALGAAALNPAAVRKLVLYEHPGPHMFTARDVALLENFAKNEDWDKMVQTFMLEVLRVPPAEVELIASTPFWDVWTDDARATLCDLRAIVNHKFDVERFHALDMPVMLMIGTESPRDIYMTDKLKEVLPGATIVALQGQAHEGMTTAPEQFVEAISKFLLGT
jgi:pimeloyl-ACP methyl ester carboxylesterase